MTAFDKLSDRVPRFKRTGPVTGIGSCPTEFHKHGDRSRGLSIRARDDKVVIYCHAGCGAGDIVAALGLTLSDLFDKPLTGTAIPPTHSKIPPRDLLELVDQEVLVVTMLALKFRETKQLTEEDWTRLTTAAARIGRARDHAHGY